MARMSLRGYHAKKRNSYTRERKPVILIAAEGRNKTETNYLTEFARDKRRLILFASGRETDPVNLIQALIRDYKKNELERDVGDRAYCLIDADTDPSKNTQISEADRLASENSFSLIVSNPCFEIWFICHYTRSARHYTRSSAVIDHLKEFYPEYTKSSDGLYDRLKDEIHSAIENAKYLEQSCSDAGYRPHTVEYSPSTDMYKLAEELLRE